MNIKSFLSFIVLLSITLNAFSGIEKFSKSINYNKSGKVNYIEIKDDIKVFKNSFKEWYIGSMELSNEFSLEEINSISDKSANFHQRYILKKNEYKIHDKIVIAHYKDGKLYAISGNIDNNIKVSGKSLITEENALSSALQYFNAEIYMWQIEGEEYLLKRETNNLNATYFPKAEKYLVRNSKNEYLYTYRFNIYSKKPIKREYVFIDAENGKVVKTLPLLYHANENGTAYTKYSGTQNIITDSYNSSYRLRETSRGLGVETYNMQMGTNYSNAVDFTDDDNSWNNINPEQDEVATDAHWATEMTYDYFYNIHNRNSIDGNGFKLRSYVHFNLIDYGYNSNVNAFWDGQSMTYGDGSSTITPLTTVDICGHEITHGLTSYTANLDYQDESGALNEAFSDIFGSTIEHYARPSNWNWAIGEDIGTTFRSLQNPNAYNKPDTYYGNHWVTDGSDNGGVHTNSLVYGHWFYLTSVGGSGTNDINNTYNVTGIGIDKAEQIAFRTLTVYLTNTSDYHEARFFTILSAIDLYGSCSPEVETVTNAFYAIGVGGAYVPTTLASFSSVLNSFCKPPATVNFSNNSINGTSFIWNFGDGNNSTDVNPSHVYTSYGDFDVQLIADGGTCGIDTLKIIAHVSIQPANQCIEIMTENSTSTDTSCSGKLYDSGGPLNYQNNTNSVFTISPTGASGVVLNFISFDFEQDYDYLYIYDGPNDTSPLIGKYDGNQLPNGGTIISSGSSITLKQTSDQGLTKSGFELDWYCLSPNDPPVCNFYSADTNTCSGYVVFNDLSFNNPQSWLWYFGDGTTSNLQNPTHNYSNNGFYTVSLVVGNQNGTDSLGFNNYIFVNKPVVPIATNDTVCKGLDALLIANANGNINWYDSLSGGNLIYTGDTLQILNIQNDITYYVENFIESQVQFTGKTDNSGGGGYFGNVSYIHYVDFDTYSPFKLISVKVYAQGDGNRSIALRNSSGVILKSIDVFIPDGESRVTLNFDVPVGNNLQLVGLGAPNLFRNNGGVNYPYIINGLLSINKSSAGTSPLQYYYYFYDWEVKEPECASQRVAISAFVNENNFSFSQDIVEVQNLPYQIDAGVGYSSYSWSNGDNTQITNLNTYGWYWLTVTDINGCEKIDSIYLKMPTQISTFEMNSDFKIYPNPNHGMFIISSEYGIDNIQIFDIIGNLIYEKHKLNHQKNYSIDLSSLPKGVYNVKVSAICRRVVIQ